MVRGTRAEGAAVGKRQLVPGGKRRPAHLHRAERTGHFQIQLSGNQEMQLASKQQMVFGDGKQMAEVLVRSSVGALDGLAEERAGRMGSPRAAQLLEEHSRLQFLNH